MRIAILADVHGNLAALHAVVEELERVDPAPDHIVVNGDLINGTPLSSEVIDYIRKQDWIVVRGNHEFYYLDYGTERAPADYEDAMRWGQLHWLIEQITFEQGSYLALLPDERTFYIPNTEPIRIAHGVPGNNRIGFAPHQPSEEIVPKISHVPENVLITAHSHVQFDRYILTDFDRSDDGNETRSASIDARNPSRHGRFFDTLNHQISLANLWWHLINPGSVGLPLNGNINAQFVLLDSHSRQRYPDGWKASHCQVPYDRRPVLDSFHSSGMLQAGGTISLLFYWELCTAEPEIIHFYRWAIKNGYQPDADMTKTFHAYVNATGRDSYVKEQDPCHDGPTTI
ncbi:MAG: metallophosphoesterase [Chloroflexota bacterium]